MPEHQSIRDTLRQYYAKTARERDSRSMQDWKKAERDNFLALLRQHGKTSLLEVGAGPGRDAKFFQDHGIQTVCVDLSPEMVALCKEKGLDARVMDMADLSFPGRAFDAVYAMNSLLHIPKAEFQTVLRRIDALLKPDGLFFLGLYGGVEQEGVWENDTHLPKRFFSFYTDADMQSAVRQVFDLLSFKTVAEVPDDPVHFQSMVLRKRLLEKSL